MKTITFDEHTEEGRTLMNVAKALKKSAKNAMISIRNADVMDKKSLPAGRIPGMPYTHEERMAELDEAIEEFENGECGMSWEEFKKEAAAWR